MRFRLLCLLLILFVGTAFAIEIGPVVTESAPTANSEYTTAPQLIPYRIMLDTHTINNEINRLGQGGQLSGWITFHSAADPDHEFGFNEVFIQNRGGMYPYGTWGLEGDIVSKHLSPGPYLIRVNFLWRFGMGEPQTWHQDIPIQLTGGVPTPIPTSTYTLEVIVPAEDSADSRYPVGTENTFPFTFRLTQQTPGKSVISLGKTFEIRSIENPDVLIPAAQAEVRPDWMGFENTTGTVLSHAPLPTGHYELVGEYTWKESDGMHTPLITFEYTGELHVPFEVFDPANDHFVVERSLPHNQMISGTLFVSRLLVDSRSDSPTGVVITEPIPSELEYVLLEDELAPESTSPLVWLLRNPERVPFTEIRYGLRVKEGVAAGTVIHLTGQSEILGDSKPIGGDNTITVAGLSLACPIPNQILLGHIDTWGRFVRDELRPDDAIVDDLTLLQIIDRWKNCIRGGAPV